MFFFFRDFNFVVVFVVVVVVVLLLLLMMMFWNSEMSSTHCFLRIEDRSICDVNASIIFPANGTVSAKIAPRLKCYKNASRLNRYNFPMDNAMDFLFSTLHTTPFHYEVLKIGSQ